MSLFVVNRYVGEEKKTETESHNHLSELLKRIEERKAERESENKSKESDVNKSKKKKKKGLKRSHEVDTVIQNDVVQSDVVESDIDIKKLRIDNEEKNSKDKKDVVTNFTILGNHKKAKVQVAHRVLPEWLTNPNFVSADLHNGPSLDKVRDLLNPDLIEKLKADDFHKMFPVQSEVLSWLVKCNNDYKQGKWIRDVCVCMPTGSGKTLAYALPIIQLLRNRFVPMIRCLVVLPVQELAIQVYKVIQKYSKGTSLKVALISGAAQFQDEQEQLIEQTERGDYNSKVDIVVATSGRLVDHIKKTKGFSLSALRFLVIDEADRATDWLQYIPYPHSKPPPLTIGNVRSGLNKPAQKILLSATLSQDPEKLSRLGLFKPILFTSAVVDFKNLDKDINLDKDLNNFTSRYGNPSELTERAFNCEPQYKPLALYSLLTEANEIEKTLVFTNSSEAAHRLAILLRSLLVSHKINIGELSAQLGSKQREKILNEFTEGSIRILVSSDALARGLDVPKIKHVISYDLPKHEKSYIHRSGRTGRGGIPGTATSLLLPNQVTYFGKMLSKVGKSVIVVDMKDLKILAESINYENHLENLESTLTKEQEKNLKRLKPTR